MSTVATGPGEHITVVVEREGDSKFEIKTTDLERVSRSAFSRFESYQAASASL
jgi:hypothetical protein